MACRHAEEIKSRESVAFRASVDEGGFDEDGINMAQDDCED
jgi:hypothetical protein